MDKAKFECHSKLNLRKGKHLIQVYLFTVFFSSPSELSPCYVISDNQMELGVFVRRIYRPY